jgi:hypothetical protein
MADAAKLLDNPDAATQAALNQAAREGMAPGRVPEPDDDEPEAEAPEQEDGSHAEPAEAEPEAPVEADEDEEITDDYDPEAQVAEPEPETPETPTPETPPEPTTPPAQTLSPEELEEYRQMKAAQEKQAQPAEPEKSEPDKDPLVATVQRLTQERPEVADLADKVGKFGQQLRERAPKIEELQTKISPTGDLSRTIVEKETLLKYHVNRAKAPETDPDEVRYAINEAQMELVNAKNELLETSQQLQSLEFTHSREAMEYEQTLNQLRGLGQDELDAQSRAEQQEALDQEEYDAATKEWEAALPSVMREWGLSKALQPDIDERLSILSEKFTDDELSDIGSWMRTQKDSVLSRLDLIRQETAKERAVKLSADAEVQTAPPPSRAVAKEPRKSKGPLNSRDAHLLAGRQMAESAKGVR